MEIKDIFFPKTNQQASDFLYYIIETPHFSFDKKISLYEQIPYFKKLTQYSKIKDSLRFVQQLRNALAHWNLDEKLSNNNEVVIYNPNTFKILKLNDEIMRKFQEHEKILLKVFGWEQTLREKNQV